MDSAPGNNAGHVQFVGVEAARVPIFGTVATGILCIAQKLLIKEVTGRQRRCHGKATRTAGRLERCFRVREVIHCV